MYSQYWSLPEESWKRLSWSPTIKHHSRSKTQKLMRITRGEYFPSRFCLMIASSMRSDPDRNWIKAKSHWFTSAGREKRCWRAGLCIQCAFILEGAWENVSLKRSSSDKGRRSRNERQTWLNRVRLELRDTLEEKWNILQKRREREHLSVVVCGSVKVWRGVGQGCGGCCRGVDGVWHSRFSSLHQLTAAPSFSFICHPKEEEEEVGTENERPDCRPDSIINKLRIHFSSPPVH